MIENITTALRVQGQMPLDAKNIEVSLLSLKEKISENPLIFYSFYKGMEIYIQDEGQKIIWDEVSPSNSSKTILDDNHIYPTNVIYEEYDYSGKEFNFFYTNSLGNLTGSYGIEEDSENNQNYL